jgi:hypothetical protein
MRISRNNARASLFVVAVIVAAGCSLGKGGTAAPAPTAGSTSAATTTAPPTPPCCTPPPSTTPPPTTAPPLILTTPQAAAEHLYNAWKANDKTAAALGASSAAVAALFAKKWKSGVYFFGGCTEPVAPSECDYNWSGGIIAMKIDGNKTAGFRVVSVSTGSAG